MTSKFLTKLIILLVFVIVIGTPLFYFRWGIYPYTFSKQLFFQGVVELAFFFWLCLAIVSPKYRPRLTPFTIAVAVFLAALLLASFTGIDVWRSFWSTYERGIGVFAFLHLAVLALIVSSLYEEIPWKKLLYASLGTSLFIDVIAWAQIGVPNLLLIENPGSRPGATFGNPAFLAGYLLFHIFLAVYFLIDSLSLRASSDVSVGASAAISQFPVIARSQSERGNLPRYPRLLRLRRVVKRSSATLLRRLAKDRNDDGEKRHFLTIFFIIAAAADAFTILLGQTRGDELALVAGILILCAYFAVSPPAGASGFLRKRSTYAALIGAVALFAAIFFFTRQNAVWDRVPGLSRFRSLSFSIDNPEVAPRIFALRAAWQGFLERPILGWGPENFTPVYDRHYDPRALEESYNETRSDKPHNFQLEYLVDGGVVLFAAFLFLFAAALYEAFRQKDRLWLGIFIASLGAYAVGNFFLFETLGPLLMLYLLFGAVDGAFRANISSLRGSSPAGERPRQSMFEIARPHAAGGRASPSQGSEAKLYYPASQGSEAKLYYPASARNDMEKKIPHYLIWPCALAGAALAYFVNVQSLLASYYQYNGFQQFLRQNIFFGLRSFEKAGSTWTPYAWNFKRDYAIAVAGQYFNYPGTVSDQDALVAVLAMEQVRDEHPEDAFNHYALVNLYNEVANTDKEVFTRQAEAEANAALAISPGRQEAYFYLAKTKVIEGDYAGALLVLKTALDEDPKVPDAHFYYGLVAFAMADLQKSDLAKNGLKSIGYLEIKTAIAIGRQWKTFYEPRTVAGFFADSGHLDEAISLYETAWDMSQHGDADTEVKLAVAYFYGGRRDDAKRLLEDAAKRLDFSKSPLYGQLKPILDALGISH